MKRTLILILTILLCCGLIACHNQKQTTDIVATTLPVYEITARLCHGTDLQVTRLITEEVSCLHDYTLQPGQMKAMETATLTVLSGAGLEAFLSDILPENTVDASQGISLLCTHHDHEGHDHEHDPHIWLSPENGKKMAENIYAALCDRYPEYKDIFSANCELLNQDFNDLIAYGKDKLSSLSYKELVTFHDGFSYMAQAYGLTVLHSMEEESGSEASAKELIAICKTITDHNTPAVFIEKNGSDRAASIVAQETGAKIYTLDTAMSGGYLTALYHNIDTLKEALG